MVYIYTPMETLSPRQRQTLDLIRKAMADGGLPPTRAELMRAMGLASPNAAEKQLRTLARKGAIELLAGTSRGIRLLAPARQKKPAGLPLIGQVAAGAPLLAEEHILSWHALDAELFQPRADYLLKVRGTSMVGAGIKDGDLLAVHRTGEARSGQIVVARFHDEVTVKRLRRRGNAIELLPENPDFKAISVDPRREDFAIEGIAVGLLRNGSF